MSFTGASGRLPDWSVHVLPPLVDSKTWPTPPPGIQRRENAPYTTTTWLAFDGSTQKLVGIRLGRLGACTVCQLPPTFVSMPEMNGAAPPGLHPLPHQPA